VLQCLLDLEHGLATEAVPSEVGPVLPTCAHLEGPISVVPNSGFLYRLIDSSRGVERVRLGQTRRASIVLLMRSWMRAGKALSTLNVLKGFINNVSYELKSCFRLYPLVFT
jgi:hypothetical protein